MYRNSLLWRIIYIIWPPFIRLFEFIGFHKGRQPHAVGFLKPGVSLDEARRFLESKGYEHCILAWRDAGEILGHRLVHRKVFQYHVRIFKDGEVRAHYEYSLEGNPIKHVLETVLDAETPYFKTLLGPILKS